MRGHAPLALLLLLLAGCGGQPTTGGGQSRLADRMEIDREGPQTRVQVAARVEAARVEGLELGQTPAMVERSLGPPELGRAEPPALIWQYRGVDCVLSLFFYGSGGEQRLTDIAARSRRGQPVDPSRCVAAISSG